MLDQLIARGDAAGPTLALGVEAKLIGGGRIDAAEAYAGAADLDLVSLADFRHAADVDGVARGRPQQDEAGERDLA
jgi:hypothetical protein